jgi:hypothetical protein
MKNWLYIRALNVGVGVFWIALGAQHNWLLVMLAGTLQLCIGVYGIAAMLWDRSE